MGWLLLWIFCAGYFLGFGIQSTWEGSLYGAVLGYLFAYTFTNLAVLEICYQRHKRSVIRRDEESQRLREVRQYLLDTEAKP